jgi:predicted acyltransferase
MLGAVLETRTPSRIEFLDQFRGFTMALMIVVNLLSGFRVTPSWLKHATVMGSITITDFVITMFIFAQLRLRFLPFRVLGRNALVIFMLHGILVLLAPVLLSPASPLPVVLAALAVVYALCFLLAGILYARRISIRL